MESTATMNLSELHDGTIIISGDINNHDAIISFFNDPKGYIVKYTADLKTEIWRRYIARYWIENVDNYVRGMMLTSDKGILINGYTMPVSATLNDAWVIKIDNCGYTVGDIPEPKLLIDSIINKTVYITEHSKNYCTAELDWGYGTENFQYYAYENKKPLTEKHFQHNYTDIDQYTIKITTLAGEEYMIVENTNAQMGTKASSSSVSNWVTNAPPFKGARGISFQATIKTPTGKIIKIINLNSKRYQQEINVSNLPNGVYFVKFTINGEQVGVEKMVIAR